MVSGCARGSVASLFTHLAKRIAPYADLGNEKRIDCQLEAVKERAGTVLQEREQDGEETCNGHAGVEVNVARRVHEPIRQALHDLVARQMVVRA